MQSLSKFTYFGSDLDSGGYFDPEICMAQLGIRRLNIPTKLKIYTSLVLSAVLLWQKNVDYEGK